MVYIISFIIGVLIELVLYGKVPIIISLIIAYIVGGLIGYVYNRIQRKKAEREYVEWLKHTGLINVED